jgi:PAS domain S-box-containing protein/putative nucleotidyltransferase with HDIG domain
MEDFRGRLENNHRLDRLKSSIISYTPQGIIIIDKEGIIEYVNPSVGTILGSTETVGLNMLHFDTVINSSMYQGIIKALNGIPSELYGEHYISYTTGYKKVLNVFINPVISEDSQVVEGAMLVLHDITEEYNLRLKMESTYLSTIAALAEAIDARDEYTGEHSKNVSKFVELICNNLDISREEINKIKIAATIHDIGKIGVRDYILNKPDKLTFEEYEIMKRHPVIGSEIIGKINDFDDIAKIIRYHHERWDGNGYPDKLKGDEIPMGSQIIAIADTYDAIASNRVYRKSLGKDRAIEILLEERGKQFNSELVDMFIREIVRYSIDSQDKAI